MTHFSTLLFSFFEGALLALDFYTSKSKMCVHVPDMALATSVYKYPDGSEYRRETPR
jgi:hypothetical protein